MNLFRLAKVLENPYTRKIVIYGFLFLMLISFGFFTYDSYKEAQPTYTTFDDGSEMIRARASDFFLFTELEVPDVVPKDMIPPQIDGTKISKYEFKLDKDKNITEASYSLKTKDAPEVAFEKYKNKLGDGFEYQSEFKHNISGTYNANHLNIDFLRKKESGNYLILIDIDKN